MRTPIDISQWFTVETDGEARFDVPIEFTRKTDGTPALLQGIETTNYACIESQDCSSSTEWTMARDGRVCKNSQECAP